MLIAHRNSQIAREYSHYQTRDNERLMRRTRVLWMRADDFDSCVRKIASELSIPGCNTRNVFTLTSLIRKRLSDKTDRDWVILNEDYMIELQDIMPPSAKVLSRRSGPTVCFSGSHRAQ